MRSIRNRLLAGTVLGVSLAFAISGVLVLVLARSALRAQFDDALLGRARAMAALVEQDGETVESELDPSGIPGDATVFELWDGDASVLRSVALGSGHLTRTPGEIAFADVELADETAARQVTLQFTARREGDEPSPRRIATLALARSTEELGASVSRLATVLIGAGALGTLLCLAILAGVVRFGLSPLRSLAAAIAELKDGDLAVRLATTPPAELGPVVDRLDALLARLSATLARERELTAEVAHELRTPLAGLRATIEVALSRDDRPAEKYRTALADSLEITRETERLVGSLLALARLDADAVSRASAPVELADLVRELWSPLAARAEARRVTTTLDLEASTIDSDRDQLRLIVGNLLDNAVSYVDDGGTIDIRLAAGTLAVANTGCTLAPADAPRVVERFWRGDAARSGGAHAGLGLALASRATTLLGLRLGVTIDAGRFTATLTT